MGLRIFRLGFVFTIVIGFVGEASQAAPIIRKVDNVGGEITINPRPAEFNLTFTHRDLGRDTDCRGILTAEVIVGNRGRIVKDLSFEFTDVAPTETFTMRFGSELLAAIRADNSDIEPELIKFDKNSDYLDIKNAYCFFGPPVDTKIILGDPKNQVRVYVHASSVNLLFSTAETRPFRHYRCTFGISAKVAKSKNPEEPLVFKISTGQVNPRGLTHAFGGIKEIQQRRSAEEKPDLEYDYEPGQTRVVNRYCWLGGEAQFATSFNGEFTILPGGKELIWYNEAKKSGVISTIASEKDGPSLDTAAKGPWRSVAVSSPSAGSSRQFAVSKAGKVSIYDAATFTERHVLRVAGRHGQLSLSAAKDLVVLGDKVIDTLTGDIVHSFPERLRSHAFTPDNQQLIAAFDREDNRPLAFTVGQWQSPKEHPAFTNTANIIAEPDSSGYLFSSGTFVFSIEIATGKVRKNISTGSAIAGLSLTDDGSILAILENQQVSLWDYSSCTRLLSFPYTGQGKAIQIRKIEASDAYAIGIKRRLVRKNLIDFWTVKLPKEFDERGCQSAVSLPRSP